VLVATSEDKLAPGQADAWDSGKVATRLPIVEHAGEPIPGPIFDELTHQAFRWGICVVGCL